MDRKAPDPGAAGAKGTKIAYAVLVVAALYFAAAKFGLSMASPGVEQVTLVWPPSGIALAAVVLLGSRAWPGIALGAFVANITVAESVPTALAIAAGNTVEALVGVGLLRRVVGFDPAMSRLKDVAALVVLAAACATTIAATVGATALCVGGTQPWSRFDAIWQMWWLGDAIGILVFAPAFLAWSAGPRPALGRARLLEALLLGAGVVSVSFLAYGRPGTGAPHDYPLQYLAFPFLIWAALRFGQVGATTTVLVVSVIAVRGTVLGFGPFYSESLADRLFLVQLFLAVSTVTGMFLGAAIGERVRAEERLRTDLEVGRILEGCESLEAAAPGILRAVGRTLHWGVGIVWRVDPSSGLLRCVETWTADGVSAPEFTAASHGRTFERGVGLPGRVLESGTPAWIEDVTRDANFPRAAIAAREGLHGAFGFPIAYGDAVVGVIEFFSRRIRRPDRALLDMMGAVGLRIGEFMARQEVEGRRHESETRLRFLAESLPSSVWIASVDGTAVYANRRWYEYTGLSPEDDTRSWAERVVHPEDLKRIREQWARAVRDGTSYEAEVRHRGRDGTYRWFISRAAPWRDADGRITSWFGVTSDIHDQKLMQRSLEEADRRKDEYLATLAHELRNPLAPLSNALHLLHMEGDEELRDEALATARRQLDVMVRLVDDLMDVSRITSGKIQLRIERVDLVDVVGQAVETSRPLIESSRQTLSVELPKPSVTLDVDRMRISQAISNLLNNAAKYGAPGGRIQVRAVVAESAPGRNPVVELRVRDEGVGIPPELLSRIFEPFLQANPERHGSQSGLGIGLTLVKRLVEMHGGEVEARSDGPGKGSEFVVRLPLPANPDAVREVARVAAPDARRDPSDVRRVLVVDDSAASAKTMAALLTKLGHEVATVHDGEKAVAAASAFLPDLVLLDIGLPGIDGYEAARRIRVQPRGESISLVALTGWSQEEDRRRSREAGFDEHLVKPVDRAVLERVLARPRRTPAGSPAHADGQAH